MDPAAPQPAAGGRGGGRGGAPTVTVVVKMQDGREIRGVRRNEDTFSLQVIDSSGQLRLLDRTKLASVTVDTGSLHPSDYATKLSASDIANLVAYLRAQQGRDLTRTAAAPPLPGGVAYERLLNAAAEPHNWLMYRGNYQGTHFSPLKASIPTTWAGFAPRGRRRFQVTR